MKKVLFAAFLLVSSNAIFAQVNQGQWLAGGNAGFNSWKRGDSKSTTIFVNPNVGYFFINNLAGGLRLGLESEKVKGDEDATVQYGVAPFVRYYFLPAAQKVNVFADASYGFDKIKQGDAKASGNHFSIMAGPAVFLSPNTALEFALYYSSYGGDRYENVAGDRSNNFGLSIGFQVHLGGGASSAKK
ncbi:porin family protein [Niastella caeni]|uniref:Porin family protein n=1 Tax=Niastella caeni TaxID=2569763 RepID=A0A4S8HJM5_9BACT|nr:outer membrane beta-barrel protein [Niastella caeni]THU34811.1 porin family protein [Niastella caeni]